MTLGGRWEHPGRGTSRTKNLSERLRNLEKTRWLAWGSMRWREARGEA